MSPRKRSTEQAPAATDVPKRECAPQKTSNPYQAIREQLLARRKELKGYVQGDTHDLQTTCSRPVSGSDEGDTGEYAGFVSASMMERSGEELAQIEHALDKIDEGTYGQCEECGRRISKTRLEALGAVFLCVKCKEETEEWH